MGCIFSAASDTKENPVADAPRPVSTANVELKFDESPSVSSYNDAYYCTVDSVIFSEDGIALHFVAVGDGSLGDLQGAENSSLTCGGVDCGPCRVDMHDSDPSSKIEGYINFPLSSAHPFGKLMFTYGNTGYSEVEVVDMTEGFCVDNDLMQFSWTQDA